MTIKQNKGQTILFAVITLIAVVGLFCFAIFDIRKLNHDYSFILDNAVAPTRRRHGDSPQRPSTCWQRRQRQRPRDR